MKVTAETQRTQRNAEMEGGGDIKILSSPRLLCDLRDSAVKSFYSAPAYAGVRGNDIVRGLSFLRRQESRKIQIVDMSQNLSKNTYLNLPGFMEFKPLVLLKKMKLKIKTRGFKREPICRLLHELFISIAKNFNVSTFRSRLKSVLLSGRAISRAKVFAALVLVYTYGILILSLCIYSLQGSVGGHSVDAEIIRIRPGMSATEIGYLLAERGFIKSAFLFRIVSMLNGTSRTLKAGDYALNTDMSMFRILRKIVAGEAVLYRFTIPEGFIASEIARLWEVKGFGSRADFEKALLDPSTREQYGIDSDNLEGYLFPDTYIFTYGISEQEAIGKMLSQFNKKVLRLIENELWKVKFSQYEIISLASIIEKEAKVEAEKPLISAVFQNRLKAGRRLESCATVLYSFGYPDRKLTLEDLRNPSSPYNTYVYKGLPPGPICNPGLSSISAALNPSNDKYLYFVSKNDGTHCFSESYREFLKAKRKFQTN